MSKHLLQNQPIPVFLKNPTTTQRDIYFPILEPQHTGAQAFDVLLNLPLPLRSGWNLYLKRLVDFFFSTLFILLVFPWLLPLLALVIKLESKGPVFFLQRRHKKNGVVFTCIKFRSMYVNREADVVPASENDARITRVGKFLRDHHLDELPQLFNVWLGDMSLIGPRPHMISDNKRFEEVIPFYQFRHKVKPGITGLAQVFGFVGPVTDVVSIWARIEKDHYYVRNWSFTLDMKIAFRTILQLFGMNQRR